jgi:molecular chaperone DnaK (HSP70)
MRSNPFLTLLLCLCVQVEIIANDQGNRTMPSYVAFTDSERLIGEAAKNQAAMNPKNTIFDAKRLIGRNFSDRIVQEDMKLWPFKVRTALRCVSNSHSSPCPCFSRV